ncbi:MAG: 3-phosphoshikimate 1-carboxyvinyltransferase [Planctomycetes bacterium]|nr:3-phosphoshikimate 1-carboxyvinyltransferase [Planctomycetota bacterium]
MKYPDQLTVPVKACKNPLNARVPGSKSLTNRALIAAALCLEDVELKGPLKSEDTELAFEALAKLGVCIECDNDSWHVKGGGLKSIQPNTQLYLGNAGTAVRFLTSVLSTKNLQCSVTGSERMLERPIELLTGALNDLGANIQSDNKNGCLPLTILPSVLKGGEVSISGKVSSQYFSGLMMAAPLALNKSVIKVSDKWLSLPYIEMTHKMLQSFGLEMELGADTISIPGGQQYSSPGTYSIEPDATAATYPLALGVLHGTPVSLEGLGAQSLQGDVRFAEVMEMMGCELSWAKQKISLNPPERLKSIETDLNDIPDAAMTIVTLACVAEGVSRFTGLSNLAFKECDRLKALECELNKMGAKVQANADGFVIEGVPIKELKGAEIHTYDDHRMAMCLALLGTIVPDTVIYDPSCVKKTYPNFWDDLTNWLN